ncbi:MAG: methionyl-tRNA formyltransferase, partial [Agathobacter sp.]|nr:methionyl-tRNA formyltransferase [Agathobacter sp.]
INIPKYKTINCHAGKLPFYRGRNILNWALINDEKEFGITVHYVDEGIDTGDIILQRCFEITDSDTYKTLLNIAYTECAEVLYDALKMIQKEEVRVIYQDEIDKVGMYCGMRQEGDEILDWNQNSRDVFNFVRAICDPGPMAQCYCDGVLVKVNKVREVDGVHCYKGIPGQIIGKTQEGFYVKTKDSMVEMIEFITEKKLRVGSRLKKEKE